jgi:streptogramin lyase
MHHTDNCTDKQNRNKTSEILMKSKNIVAAMMAMGAALMMTGCAGMTSNSAPTVVQGAALKGIVMGGQQPVAGASIYLYAANTTAYSGTNTNILTTAVTTNAGGGFGITGDYTCTSGQMMYLVAVGGNPGAGTNNQLSLMIALGDCANLSASMVTQVNEVTTVAAVYALAPFMSSYTALGSTPTNTAGLVRAFNSANKLANTTTGTAGGPSLAAGAVAPIAELNTLGNILASCVNSAGGVAGDGSTCGNLFSYATPAGGTAPTDTIGLALAIAHHPTLNVSSISGYSSPVSPFQPSLSAAPTDLTVAINYKTGFSAPSSVTLDANGQVWVANATANSLTVLNQSGSTVQTLTGNGLSKPVAVAIDVNGNAWAANSSSTTVSGFTSAGGTLANSPFTVGTAPDALGFDAPGNLFVANHTSNSLTELTGAGSLVQTITSGVAAPTAIAINPK